MAEGSVTVLFSQVDSRYLNDSTGRLSWSLNSTAPRLASTRSPKGSNMGMFCRTLGRDSRDLSRVI